MGYEFNGTDRALALRLFDDVRRATDGYAYPSPSGAPLHGITRPSYSQQETVAMKIIAECAEASALVTSVDPAGNLHIDQSVEPASVPAVWTGSHFDSVPSGGNYDGLAGIVAGFLCLRKVQQREIVLERPVTVIGFRGEESAWFGRPYLGSSALFGLLSQDDLNRLRRSVSANFPEDPETLSSAMASRADIKRIAASERLVDPKQIAEFWELHIEQGPVLVERKRPVGLVTGIRGNTRYAKMQCRGEAGHSGAVPWLLRRDAVLAVAEFLTRLENVWQQFNYHGNDLVVTCGQLGTDPIVHSSTRIPGWVGFSLEWRSQSLDVMVKFGVEMEAIRQDIERRRTVTFEYGAATMTSPAEMNYDLLQNVTALACLNLDLPFELMASGAGHDAAIFANQGIPTGMIFVRNDRGSHNPDEAMDIDDFMRGTEVLYKALTRRAE